MMQIDTQSQQYQDHLISYIELIAFYADKMPLFEKLPLEKKRAWLSWSQTCDG